MNFEVVLHNMPGKMIEDCAHLSTYLIRSFYQWRRPARTIRTLLLLGVALLAVIFTPTWLLVKSTLLSAGIVFFALFPIGSRFPQYRLLASPLTYLFWDIPTHGEHFATSFSLRCQVIRMSLLTSVQLCS